MYQNKKPNQKYVYLKREVLLFLGFIKTISFMEMFLIEFCHENY